MLFFSSMILEISRNRSQKPLVFAKEVNDNYKTQKMTDKQKEYRISFDEVKEK